LWTSKRHQHARRLKAAEANRHRTDFNSNGITAERTYVGQLHWHPLLKAQLIKAPGNGVAGKVASDSHNLPSLPTRQAVKRQ
jgi:hypothetical protein